jgi:branched-chain amino acid transport system permease protein
MITATPIASMRGSRSVATSRGVVVTGLLLLGLCVMIFVPRVVGEYGTQIGFRALIYLTLAEAWNLLAGYGGLVSLGSSSFVGIGAYILMGTLNAGGFGIAMALAASGLGAVALAVIVSPAVFRLRGLYFTVGTLALGEALRLFMINVPYFGGATGIFLNSNSPPIEVLYVYAVALAGIATLVMEVYTGTRFSILLRSVRDDEDAASQVGVRAFRVKLMAFAVASLLMGAAGGLQALKLGAIEPYGMFGLQWSIDALSIVIIGGLGVRFGPLVGTVFVIALAETLADYPELHLAMTGVILILVIRFAPKGLCGFGQDLCGMLIGRRGRSRMPQGGGAQT